MPQLRELPITRITIDVPESPFGAELVRSLQDRGLPAERARSESEVVRAGSVVGRVFSECPNIARAIELVPWLGNQARTSRPAALLVPPIQGRGPRVDEQCAVVALFRAHGAIVVEDPNVFCEVLVLLAVFGMPAGPSVAIVAPDDTWLAASARSLAWHAELRGDRFAMVRDEKKAPSRGSDIVLIDSSAEAPDHRASRALVVPVAGSSTSTGASSPALLGLAAAIAAVTAAGETAQRIVAGLGPAEPDGAGQLDYDQERFSRQLGKLRDRVGDHETKVLLSSYAIPITRQAVATTPSAATRMAKKAGYPVEMKPWGPEQPTEPEGCLVITGIQTASEVRRAFGSLCSEAEVEAVIVRESAPVGRELSVRILALAPQCLVVLIDLAGLPAPACALAPLRPIDAAALARQVALSRAEDSEIHHEELADLLRRASHLVADHPRVQKLEIARLVVEPGKGGAIAVDARALVGAD